jgi:shikimate kinase
VKTSSKSENRNPESETRVVGSEFVISNFVPRIFLIGYRCTGKTAVARLLAEKLSWDWVDADSVLEGRYGKSIRQIFAEEGEIGFRDKEEQIFAELCRLQRCVVATGGGVILRDVNRQRMRSAGKVAWLTADAQTIWERLRADPATAEKRPPLTVGGLVEIEEALKMREPFYRACTDFTISTAGRSTEEIAKQIGDKLTRGMGGGGGA